MYEIQRQNVTSKKFFSYLLYTSEIYFKKVHSILNIFIFCTKHLTNQLHYCVKVLSLPCALLSLKPYHLISDTFLSLYVRNPTAKCHIKNKIFFHFTQPQNLTVKSFCHKIIQLFERKVELSYEKLWFSTRICFAQKKYPVPKYGGGTYFFTSPLLLSVALKRQYTAPILSKYFLCYSIFQISNVI